MKDLKWARRRYNNLCRAMWDMHWDGDEDAYIQYRAKADRLAEAIRIVESRKVGVLIRFESDDDGNSVVEVRSLCSPPEA